MRKLTEMNNAMKAKYAELFTAALDTMERTQWQKPWVSPNSGIPCNLYRRNQPYKGVNHFLLKLLTAVMGFETPYFITFNEMVDGEKKYGGLRLNEKLMLDANGMPVFNTKGLPKMERPAAFPVWKYLPRFKDKDGNKLTPYEYDQLTEEEKAECKRFFSLFNYWVWNIDQTNFKEVYPDDYATMVTPQRHEYRHDNIIDPVLERMIFGKGEWRCPILFGGMSAHYSPKEDHIRLPQRSNFRSDEAFYGTVLHEMAHSTAGELKRELNGIFGDRSYAMEEFVAELTAACVASMLGVGKLLDEQHLAYVESWREAIRENGDFIPQVIDHVQRATNYILRRYDAISKAMNLPKMLAA
ncbi:MAG: DUF1738 domain-containing protein [Bacteroidaceae bacterium]|nr:DUF1738 domain-containing protein [Bacteroidaceae bacterium]